MSELQNLLEKIEASFGVRICVHDISGITLTVRALELPYLWKTHGGWYCTEAKKFISEQACMHQKEISLYKLKRDGTRAYCGICRMGVCDYIEPVRIDGKLAAVIFASGVIRDREEEAADKIRRYLGRMHLDAPEVLEVYGRFARCAGTTEQQLRFFAELVGRFVVEAARGSAHRISSPEGNYPVESVRIWRTGTTAVLIAYLEDSFRQKITLKGLSQRFLVSEGHINRLVRQEVNMGAIAYVKRLRLDAAARDLASSDAPIHEVGEKVGYADTNYFCRIFKDAYGETPTEFRQNVRKHDPDK